MFRRLFGRQPEPEEPKSVTHTYVPATITIESTQESRGQRPEWVDMTNSDWEDFEEFFFRDKGWFRDASQWRKVLRVCHQHWNLERAIGETYYRREVDGVEPTIPLCRSQMSIAPQAKVALEFHHLFEQEFWKQNHERSKREWKRLGLGEYTGWEPVEREFSLPEHRGFKQLAIIYDKMKDFEAAIEVCEEALTVDWPGDWDVRIARYERRLETQRKKKQKNTVVSGNVVTVEAPAAEAATPNFCSHCGGNLEGALNFCPQCGSRIQQ